MIFDSVVVESRLESNFVDSGLGLEVEFLCIMNGEILFNCGLGLGTCGLDYNTDI